ncbi:MAG: 2-C-methyl-D-erythritol 4-phosphate cytidylyltransferase [Coriobacteriales bacterium]|jgi:2-C-methyl-D-erythritol 4-phosphate cytidylyltransferase|nr:2-C-methyl-D-erythritol 4-phosphate cytidylyltransferase [Coriobacteriales bacterium]
MIFAAILAGGTGTRMDLDNLPKQFLLLDGKPILIHTLEKFCLCARFDALYIGVHKDWLSHTNELLQKYHLDGFPLHVVSGGTTRNQTIMNILERIEGDFGSSAEHIVVTHDSVRPFVLLSTIEANIDAALAYGACDTVIPATDTIVRADQSGQAIERIPTRDRMYQGQTPQSFKLQAFKESYRTLDENTLAALTDACKVLLEAGVSVRLVAGDVTNIKLTTIMDYKIAQAMIASGVVDQ